MYWESLTDLTLPLAEKELKDMEATCLGDYLDVRDIPLKFDNSYVFNFPVRFKTWTNTNIKVKRLRDGKS
jgi:hypothetical protein